MKKREHEFHHVHDPRGLKELKQRYGIKFIRGAGAPIKRMKIGPEHKMLVVGERRYKDFVKVLGSHALKKTPHVYSYVFRKNENIRRDSPEMKTLLSLIEKNNPDIVMVAFRGEIAKNKLAEHSKRANRERIFASLPAPTREIVSEILPLEEKLLEKKTKMLRNWIDNSRGKKLVLDTKDSMGREYTLEGTVPRSKHEIIGMHSETITHGSSVELPGGKTWFNPYSLEGTLFLPRGTRSEEGAVQLGIEMRFQENTMIATKALSSVDRKLLRRVVTRLKDMKATTVSELGIGTHPYMTVKHAGREKFLLERIVGYVNVGFSERDKPKEPELVNFVIPKSRLEIGGKTVVESWG